jgi:pantoate--beta-alanine ligase
MGFYRVEKLGYKAASGQVDAQRLLQEAKEKIQSVPEAAIDYISIVDPDTLEDVARVDKPSLMAMAVFVGKTRLIDNMLLYPPG